MECLVDSDPPPTIDWFRDQVKLEVRRSGEKKKFKKKIERFLGLRSLCLSSQSGGRVQKLAGGQYLEIQEVKAEDSGQYSCVVTNMAGSSSLVFNVQILRKNS